MIQQMIGEAIAFRLNDPRIAPLTTVTRVTVTGDLLIAKVYLSVQGDDADERRTLSAIRHATGYLQRMLAQALSIRQCPELRFEIDDAVKGARRTLELLAENRRREPQLFAPEAPPDTVQAAPADDPGQGVSDLGSPSPPSDKPDGAGEGK